jgi:hypothetical protein
VHRARQSVERICLAECLVTNVAGGLRLLEYDCVLLSRAASRCHFSFCVPFLGVLRDEKCHALDMAGIENCPRLMEASRV